MAMALPSLAGRRARLVSCSPNFSARPYPASLAMKVIFSRKGFDSSAGGGGSLGQVSAAQGRLAKQGGGPGDLSLFWGLFQPAQLVYRPLSNFLNNLRSKQVSYYKPGISNGPPQPDHRSQRRRSRAPFGLVEPGCSRSAGTLGAIVSHRHLWPLDMTVYLHRAPMIRSS